MNTPNKSLQTPANNSFIGTWDVPMNSNFNIIDKCLGGILGVTAVPGGVLLSATDVQNLIIFISGTLTTNVFVVFPAGISGIFIIFNNTSGPFSIFMSVNGTGGTTVTVPQARSSLVYVDGTNVQTPSGGFSAVDGVSITGDGSVGNPLKTPHSVQGWWYTPWSLSGSFSSGFSSITRAGLDGSVFTFATPQPDANYAVIMTPYITTTAASNFGCGVSSQTASSFRISSASIGAGNSQIYVAVSVVR